MPADRIHIPLFYLIELPFGVPEYSHGWTWNNEKAGKGRKNN